MSVSELFLAVERNDPQLVQKIVANSPDTLISSATNSDSYGQSRCYGTIGVNAVNSKGDSVLIAAVRKGAPSIVTVLLSCGADANYTNSKGMGALLIALELKHFRIVELLLNHCMCGKSDRQERQYSIYHCTRGGVRASSCCKTCLDVRVVDKKQRNSVLMLLAAYGDPHLLRIALDRGADLRYCNSSGQDALYWAVISNNTMAVELLAQEMQRLRTEHSSSADAVAENSELLRNNRDAVPGESTVRLNSLLFKAVAFKNLPIVQQLVSLGADITSTNSEGLTAWCRAYYDYSDEICSYLEQIGQRMGIVAEVYTRSSSSAERAERLSGLSNTPCDQDIFNCIRTGDIKSIAPLIETGIDLNMKNKDQLTLLMSATFNNHFEIVKLLLQSGANPTICSRFVACGLPFTALSIAVKNTRDSIVEALFDTGEDILHTDEFTSVIADGKPIESFLRKKYCWRVLVKRYYRWREKKNFLLFLHSYAFLHTHQPMMNTVGLKSAACCSETFRTNGGVLEDKKDETNKSNVFPTKESTAKSEKDDFDGMLWMTKVFSNVGLVICISNYLIAFEEV